MILSAVYLKKKNQLSNNTLVITVMTNIGLNVAAREHGINLETTDVGDRYVIEAMKTYGSVYLTAIGGAGALLSKCVTQMECVAYEEFGAEAIYKFEVKAFPAIGTIDSEGHNLYIREEA